MQFKRDEATKNLEQKIKDLKKINEETAADAAKNNYEERIKDLLTRMAETESQNKTLQDQLVQAKQDSESQHQADLGELTKKLQIEQKETTSTLARVTQEKEDLTRLLEGKSNKESSLLQEVAEMQNYIDDLTD